MGFRRRDATAGKVEVPDVVKKEVALSFYYDIVQKLTRQNIPPSLSMKLDQTHFKFVPGSKAMQAKIGSTTVSIASSTERKVSFVIALNGPFLPIQAIYDGKKTRCLPQVKFPEAFCLSFNEKHWGKEKESLKINEDKIAPYLTKEREKLSQPTCATNHRCFQGTDNQSCFEEIRRTQHLTYQSPRKHDTSVLAIRPNCHWLFQTLMRRKLVEWYANKVTRPFDDGQDMESITIGFKLSKVKPLHAKWVMEAYNHMTSSIGKCICLKG